MKHLLLIFALLLTGCDLKTWGEKQYSEYHFDKMCDEYELAICGDLEGDIYVETTSADINAWSLENFKLGRDYFYAWDDGESYDYMYGYPMYGDCEDVVITMLEDLIILGMVDKGEAKWIFGYYKYDDQYHAWLEITKEGATYLYDNTAPWGRDKTTLSDYHTMWYVYEY